MSNAIKVSEIIKSVRAAKANGPLCQNWLRNRPYYQWYNLSRFYHMWLILRNKAIAVQFDYDNIDKLIA